MVNKQHSYAHHRNGTGKTNMYSYIVGYDISISLIVFSGYLCTEKSIIQTANEMG